MSLVQLNHHYRKDHGPLCDSDYPFLWKCTVCHFLNDCEGELCPHCVQRHGTWEKWYFAFVQTSDPNPATLPSDRLFSHVDSGTTSQLPLDSSWGTSSERISHFENWSFEDTNGPGAGKRTGTEAFTFHQYQAPSELPRGMDHQTIGGPNGSSTGPHNCWGDGIYGRPGPTLCRPAVGEPNVLGTHAHGWWNDGWYGRAEPTPSLPGVEEPSVSGSRPLGWSDGGYGPPGATPSQPGSGASVSGARLNVWDDCVYRLCGRIPSQIKGRSTSNPNFGGRG